MARTSPSGSLYAVAGSGKQRLSASVLCIGEDICISIWGGSRPHVGSVAIAMPRKSMQFPRQLRATSSVFNFVGHKDETVAREIAETVAMRFARNVVVTAGIHVENMTHADLVTILSNVAKLKERIIAALEKRL